MCDHHYNRMQFSISLDNESSVRYKETYGDKWMQEEQKNNGLLIEQMCCDLHKIQSMQQYFHL